jgi:hypothetical protein
MTDSTLRRPHGWRNHFTVSFLELLKGEEPESLGIGEEIDVVFLLQLAGKVHDKGKVRVNVTATDSEKAVVCGDFNDRTW